MWFNSVVNQGSIFYFTIIVPIHKTPNDVPISSITPIKRSLIDDNDTIDYSVPILLAEDNVMNQQIIRKIIRNMGFENVDVADNGQIAVEKFSKKNYKIVLMDCMMPIMSGIEATIIIRQSNFQPIIIALTADAFKDTAKKCIEAGMNHVITKP